MMDEIKHLMDIIVVIVFLDVLCHFGWRLCLVKCYFKYQNESFNVIQLFTQAIYVNISDSEFSIEMCHDECYLFDN